MQWVLNVRLGGDDMNRLAVPVMLLVVSALTPGTMAQHTMSNPRSVEQATLVPGLGTYGRKISTPSNLAQKFFDQGLNLTYGYYFPEAIATFQEALRHDPQHPMIEWGLALAIGPNPNS